MLTVSVTERTINSIQVTWEELPCESRGGVITEYNVRLIDENSVIKYTQTFPANMMYVTIPSLATDTQYTFTISATNSHGEGPQTMIHVSTLSLGKRKTVY